MYGPRVFVSMIGALLVFAAATYGLTGSPAETLVKTLVCAILLQIGYFAGVVFLVWKEVQRRRRVEGTARTAAENSAASLRISRLKEPGQPNL
ncbi:exopolysaccharide production repressor protein [Mycoplana dimorpha]|uniref:Exopolysaccharide production repressor protein n=2 Tax=Mycoplana dimorpha TaxID=28320 RepID=A0A2T5BDS5_MYCDI|nr:exopolysaccharide production repressor protein [Mycoplana dimorpha]PTM97154.1 exopolysaccharide production repressor protein [Mycoplana dimorpha]